MQIAALKQRDRSLASDEQQNALMQERFGYAQQQDQQEQALREKLAEMEAVANAPPEVKGQYIAAQRQKHPEFANTPFASMPPEQAFEGMRRGLMARLGADVGQIDHRQAQLAQSQSQFDATMKQRQAEQAAEQAHRNRQLALQAAQERRLSSGDGAKPQLVDVALGDGTTQKQWVRPGESTGAAVGAATSAQALSPKDTNTAKVKLTQVKVARNQLNEAKRHYAALKDTFSAGPGGQFIPTPAGKAFDAAVDSMRGSITALTRVPGVGAMSDYETRLDQSKFPSRGNYEQVGEQQLQALEQLLNTIEAGYSELLGGKQAPSQEAPTRRKFNPQTGKIE